MRESIIAKPKGSPWSAAAWRRFGLDQALPITKRRLAAALQGGAQFPAGEFSAKRSANESP